MENDFLKALFGKTDARRIVAVFKDGSEATYTENILKLLKTDPDVQHIYDAETGEII
jgi:hypothetical protein